MNVTEPQKQPVTALRSGDLLASIVRIDKWYAAQCNGDWEHQNGVKMETTDNPGWLVTINTEGTPLQGKAVLVQNDDWEMDSTDTELMGYADAGKLDALLNAIADVMEAK